MNKVSADPRECLDNLEPLDFVVQWDQKDSLDHQAHQAHQEMAQVVQ